MACSLRIIHDNAADRATVTVANTAPGMGPEWLLNDDKGEACRILSGEGTITLTWAAHESVAGVALPATNLSADSEVRVLVYDDAAGATLLHDTDWQWAAPGGYLGEEDPLVARLNLNDFTWGEVITAVWLPAYYAARRVDIQLRDPNRTYLDVARIVCGGYEQPRRGAEYGATTGLIDMGSVKRMASGSARASAGPKARQADINLSVIQAEDRSRIKRILDQGTTTPMLFSFLTGAGGLLEQSGLIYGYQRSAGRMAFFAPGLHSAPIPIDGW